MCEKTFDELVELCKTDPDAFEEYRITQIDKAITDMCGACEEAQSRCRRYQWRLEQDLNKFKNPIARYNRMVELFWEGVGDFENLTRTLEVPETPTKKAAVLPFKSKF